METKFLIEVPASHFEIILFPAELTDKVLPLVRDFVTSALEYAHRETDIDSLWKQMILQRVQLWVVYDKKTKKAIGAATTLLQHYDLCYGLRIVTLAGNDFSLWKEPMLDRLSQFAKLHGATRIEASGRRGWARVLQPMGFEPAYVTFIKELE